ncbi:hypothetical protein TNCV_2072101 [Trichonephila clavipes]|nr:hypothetical protein TNCV_2072101 [Trichonephila clavipes]
MEYRLSKYSPTERKVDDRGQCNVWYNGNCKGGFYTSLQLAFMSIMVLMVKCCVFMRRKPCVGPLRFQFTEFPGTGLKSFRWSRKAGKKRTQLQLSEDCSKQKAKTGEFKRPITKICILPIDVES